jgi:ribosomal protein S18 acetylase RimI-like enzyme
MEFVSLNLGHLNAIDAVNRVSLSENYDWFTWYTLLTGARNVNMGVMENGMLVAYICMIVTKPSLVPHSKSDYHIASIAVLPQYRRKGLASHLIQKALEKGGILGGKTVDLFVRADNQGAIDLYKKLHFVSVNKIPQYYVDNTDAFVMRREIEHF